MNIIILLLLFLIYHFPWQHVSLQVIYQQRLPLFSTIEIHDVIARPSDVTSDHPTRFLGFPLDNFSGSTGGATASGHTNLLFNSARPLGSYWLLKASPQ